jgi:hypothetical protein
MTTDKNGNHVTLARVYEALAPIEQRVRRVEYAVVALLVATASPKLGGPTANDVVATTVRFIF